ncbi:plastid transcriptionally active 3, partial [Tanacetum coccineum]
LVYLFGSKGYANRGLEILAAMDKLNYDIRHVWLVLIGTLRSNHQADANKVFLKGVESRLRATDEIYDLLIEEDCDQNYLSQALNVRMSLKHNELKPNVYYRSTIQNSSGIGIAYIWVLIAPMSRLLKSVIQLLIAGQNIRKFVKDGFIINELPKIYSRSHARRMKEAKRKGRHSGYGIFLAFLFVFL